MGGIIAYRGKTELDAIALWCKDHADALEVLRRLFVPDSVEEATRTTFKKELNRQKSGLETSGILDGLAPDSSWPDAKIYMARLVCYVWSNFERYNSNEKAADYVFRIAREGGRLYADCRYARTLLEKYGKQASTIRKEAKILHAAGTHFKKGRWSGMEMPPTMTQLAKKSKAEEEREKRRENNMNRRMKND